MDNFDVIKEDIDNIILEMEGIIDRLDAESQYRPLKLLGIKASYQLMNSIYASLFTITATVLQKVYTRSA